MRLYELLCETVDLIDDVDDADVVCQLCEQHEAQPFWTLILSEADDEDEDEDDVEDVLTKPKHNPKTSKEATLTSANTANLKIEKANKKGVFTVPLHLSPADLSGYNVCPMHSPGCKNACLHTAGHPMMMPAKEKARLARTIMFMKQRPAFMTKLADNIATHLRRSNRKNMIPAIRLNATSDLSWERIPVIYKGEKFRNIMDVFPDVSFYDYTKIAKRVLQSIGEPDWPENYHLT
jgi:hypothetical protein